MAELHNRDCLELLFFGLVKQRRERKDEKSEWGKVMKKRRWWKKSCVRVEVVCPQEWRMKEWKSCQHTVRRLNHVLWRRREGR